LKLSLVEPFAARPAPEDNHQEVSESLGDLKIESVATDVGGDSNSNQQREKRAKLSEITDKNKNKIIAIYLRQESAQTQTDFLGNRYDRRA
jgi:hypothetical protein